MRNFRSIFMNNFWIRSHDKLTFHFISETIHLNSSSSFCLLSVLQLESCWRLFKHEENYSKLCRWSFLLLFVQFATGHHRVWPERKGGVHWSFQHNKRVHICERHKRRTESVFYNIASFTALKPSRKKSFSMLFRKHYVESVRKNALLNGDQAQYETFFIMK